MTTQETQAHQGLPHLLEELCMKESLMIYYLDLELEEQELEKISQA
jgi:hypothetical protein